MKRLLFPILFLMMSGCKVGPNYSPPDTFVPEYFIENQACNQTPFSDEDFFHWWEVVFKDPVLDELLEETLLSNFDIRIALEKIYQARANYWVQFTSILPDFESDFQATRFRTSESFATTTPLLPPIKDFFQIGIDAIWQIDIFGKFRRSATSAYDTWEATIEDERGVRITVLSEVATIYVAIRYYQTKVDLAQQLVEFDNDLVAMAEESFLAGLANESAVVSALSTLETDKATLNVLQTGLKQNIFSLAVLLGRLPEDLVDDFSIPGPLPIACSEIPETLPSDLLRRRPDIAGAERRLAAQTEQIGVAVADLFPSVSLIGSSSSFAANPLQGANIGYSTDKFSRLFRHQSLIWGIGTLITWPVFDFGKRYADVQVQEFLANQDYLTYQKTVVTAFQEVEIALATYFNDEERVAHFTKQEELNKRNLDLIADQYQAGLASYIQVLQAKEQWLIAANLLVDSQQALDNDIIAIYRVLGGSW